MAAKKPQSPAMEFLVASLKKNPQASYADLKVKADEQKLEVYPIMFGRAQAMLGIVKSAKRGQGKAAKARAGKAKPAASAAAPAKRGRPTSANSKSAQIRELLNTGMSVADIAKKVGSSANLVYVVKSKKDGAGKRGPGRPRGAAAGTAKRSPGRPSKAAAGTNGLDCIIAAVRQGEQDRAQMRTALEKIGSIIDQLLR